MKFLNCLSGLIRKTYDHLARSFCEADLMPGRTYRLIRNGHVGRLDRPYERGEKSIFARREEKPPKVWVEKSPLAPSEAELLEQKIEILPCYSILEILAETAKQAYSARDEDGRFEYSIKELEGKHLSDYGLRKIAMELDLKLRATRVSDEEREHIIDAYNNLMINGHRATNDVLERVLGRNMNTVYRVLHSAENEVKWKHKANEEDIAKVVSIRSAA